MRSLLEKRPWSFLNALLFHSLFPVLPIIQLLFCDPSSQSQYHWKTGNPHSCYLISPSSSLIQVLSCSLSSLSLNGHILYRSLPKYHCSTFVFFIPILSLFYSPLPDIKYSIMFLSPTLISCSQFSPQNSQGPSCPGFFQPLVPSLLHQQAQAMQPLQPISYPLSKVFSFLCRWDFSPIPSPFNFHELILMQLSRHFQY